jgi:large subunit ribosomal protein L4
MIDVPVYDMKGTQTGTLQIDEAALGGEIRPRLLKQAVVTFLANQRLGTAATKSRGMVAGSTRKLYRQKGTGNARMGPIRTNIRRGGGVAFAKTPRDFSRAMPKKMRRLARNNAILVKLQSNDAMIVEDLKFDQPRTKAFAAMLSVLGVKKGCVLAMAEPNETIYKSGRNIPRTEVRLVEQLSAYEILRRQKLIFTKEAFAALAASPERVGAQPQQG